MFRNHFNPTVVAILIGFALVAGVTYLVGNPFLTADNAGNATSVTRLNDRHLYGEKSAPITIVEFSDFECPYCAAVHPTLKRLVDESEGTIAWEYRHLPLPIHPQARPAAHAAECVAEHAGESAFWQYTFDVFSTDTKIDAAFLRETAIARGVSVADYERCINRPDIAARVRADETAAAALGGSGTPFSVIVYADGSIKPVSGALPYERWLPLLKQN